MRRSDSLENTLMLGKIEGRRRRGNQGWHGWMASPTQWTWVWESSRVGDRQGSLVCCSPWGHKESDMTEQLNWTELNWVGVIIYFVREGSSKLQWDISLSAGGGKELGRISPFQIQTLKLISVIFSLGILLLLSAWHLQVQKPPSLLFSENNYLISFALCTNHLWVSCFSLYPNCQVNLCAFSKFLLFKKSFYFSLKDNCFTVLCWFLPNVNM